MTCPEYTRLAGLIENRRQAYAYIRLNEGKVHVSKPRYDELVNEGYIAMKEAMKEFGRHRLNCTVCKRDAAGGESS
jgi:hypothetical protein